MARKRKNNKIEKLRQKTKTITMLLVIAAVLTLAHQSIASMSSDNYRIWLDSLDAGGGATNSTGFKVDSNLSDFNAANSKSNSFSQNSGFSAIDNQPTIGIILQTVSLDFGILSPKMTRYSNHTLSAYTNAQHGYRLKVFGEPMHSTDHTITAIGPLAKSITIGDEQFGINLVKNTLPAIGADPSGGVGKPTLNYGQPDKYAYNSGDVIATAPSYSNETDYTITAIVNISDATAAGSYATVLTYELMPVY